MITRKDVEHIAALGRIELAPEERERVRRELSSILDFVRTLNAVDTAAVEPMTGGTDLENVMRPDVTREPTYRDLPGAALRDAAPRTRDGYVEVPAVFERE